MIRQKIHGQKWAIIDLLLSRNVRLLVFLSFGDIYDRPLWIFSSDCPVESIYFDLWWPFFDLSVFYFSRRTFEVLCEELEDEMSSKILEKFLRVFFWMRLRLIDWFWRFEICWIEVSLIQRSRAGNVLKLCLYQHRPLWVRSRVLPITWSLYNHMTRILTCRCRFTVKLVTS